MDHPMTRREALKVLSTAGLGIMASPLASIMTGQDEMRKRTIPSTGEKLAVVGLGTWIQFDVGRSESAREPLRQVLSQMAKYGGEVIDSSPMYGNSERVVGELTTDLGIADAFFYATKVWTNGRQSGINQMNASMQKMNRETMDLIEVHNLRDWQTHLRTLKQWKQEGRVRYIGVTHHTVSAHSQLEQIIQTEDIDFLQFNYSIRMRNAERGLLDTARQNDVAVIINEPYEGGSLFQAAGDRNLPGWASDYDINSWGQFFLKYILSHSAVTCVIPGTSDPEHLVDNMQAGYGRLPDEAGRRKMADYFEQLL